MSPSHHRPIFVDASPVKASAARRRSPLRDRFCGDGVAALLPSLGDARRLRLDAAAYAALLEDGRTAAPDDVGVGSLVATLGDGELPIVLWKGARRSASLMSAADDVARLRSVLGRRRAEEARCVLS